jgi:hypothetical protein
MLQTLRAPQIQNAKAGPRSAKKHRKSKAGRGGAACKGLTHLLGLAGNRAIVPDTRVLAQAWILLLVVEIPAVKANKKTRETSGIVHGLNCRSNDTARPNHWRDCLSQVFSLSQQDMKK